MSRSISHSVEVTRHSCEAFAKMVRLHIELGGVVNIMSNPGGKLKIRGSLASGLMLMSAVAASVAVAIPVSAQEARGFNIAPGSLTDVLNAYARLAGVELVYRSEITSRLTSGGLKGRFGLTEGLSRILAGTGLTYRQTGARAFTLDPVPVSSKDAIVLGPVRVEGEASRGGALDNYELESPVGPVRGYVARRTDTATKTDTPILETPQSISIIAADQIETIRPQSLAQAFGYSAGVFLTEDVDSTRDQMFVRGFELDAEYGSYFRDGLKYTVNGYNGQQEPYGLERIELLRGASSVLYGLAAPGGLVNTITKRPTADAINEVNVQIGSFERKQISVDLGGAVDSTGTLSYRLVALAREADTFTDHVPDNRIYIAPALKWQPDQATSWTLLADYQHDRTAYRTGLPALGTLLANVNGRLPRSRFVGEPDFDRYVNDRFAFTSIFEHAFSDAVSLRNAVRYLHSENDYAQIGIMGFASDDRTLARSANVRHDQSSLIAADTSLQIQFKHGLVQHKILAGVDVAQTEHQSQRFNASAMSLDIFDPVYGGSIGPLIYQDYSWRYRSRRLGLYLQDQVKFSDRWVLSLAGRQDWVKERNCAFDAFDNCPIRESSDAFTWRAGLVHLGRNGLAPFVSYSRSWEPSSGVDRSGARFRPTAGEQYEAGIRYQPAGSNMMLSAAVYQLSRDNILVDDPLNLSTGDFFQVQLGSVRSRGVELEAKFRIADRTQVLASYAYTSAKTLRSSPLTPDLAGKRTGSVPRNQAALWIDHNDLFALAGLSIGAGVRHVGSTTGLFTDFITPAYTIVDGMVRYDLGDWRLSLNLTNLTNKKYVALCPYNCFYGEPRNVKATLSYRW